MFRVIALAVSALAVGVAAWPAEAEPNDSFLKPGAALSARVDSGVHASKWRAGTRIAGYPRRRGLRHLRMFTADIDSPYGVNPTRVETWSPWNLVSVGPDQECAELACPTFILTGVGF